MKWCVVVLSLLLAGSLLAADSTIEQDLSKLNALTLDDATALALKYSLGLQVERYNPEVSDTFVTQEQSRFEPFFSSVFSGLDQDTPTGSILVGEAAINTKNITYNFAFNQLLKTGTFYDLRFDNNRVETNQAFTSVNPRYDASLFFNVTQPILRGFGKDVTTAPLRIAEADRLTSDHALTQQVMDIVLAVEEAYWDLVFAIKDLEVQRASLKSAEDLYENNKKQVEVGTMAPLEIVVAEAEVANRKERIIRAEALVRITEDRLRNIIVSDQASEKWATPVNPVDEPIIIPAPISEEEAIQKALQDNPDLKTLESDLDSKRLTTMLARDGLKPKLDLTGSVGFQGLGGERLLLTDTFPPEVIGTEPGGYSDAVSNMFDNKTFTVGFTFDLPIGNKNARAQYARADITQQQAEKRLELEQQNLILNVRTAFRNLQSALQVYEAAKASRILQERKVDAEKKKLAVGLSTNYFVLTFQDDLALATSQEVNAITSYNKFAAQLRRYLGLTGPRRYK